MRNLEIFMEIARKLLDAYGPKDIDCKSCGGRHPDYFSQPSARCSNCGGELPSFSIHFSKIPDYQKCRCGVDPQNSPGGPT